MSHLVGSAFSCVCTHTGGGSEWGGGGGREGKGSQGGQETVYIANRNAVVAI